MACWRPLAALGIIPSLSRSTTGECSKGALLGSLLIEPQSPPGINRHGFLVVTSHDPPVGVGFAAHYHHMDVLATEHGDQLLRQRLELRGPGLFPEGRAWID